MSSFDTEFWRKRGIEVAHCTKCGRPENINLLDGKDDGTGDFNLLECIRCYGEDWAPCGYTHLGQSIRSDLSDAYEHWLEAHSKGGER